MHIGQRIKTLRKERRISQGELADAINVDRSNISQWETGNAQPHLSNLQAVANYFAVDISSLLDESGRPAPGDKLNAERAFMLAILDDYATWKSQVTGVDSLEVKKKIEKKAKLILKGLDAWPFPEKQG